MKNILYLNSSSADILSYIYNNNNKNKKKIKIYYVLKGKDESGNFFISFKIHIIMTCNKL